jgi:hemolysin activation/secretion protein
MSVPYLWVYSEISRFTTESCLGSKCPMHKLINLDSGVNIMGLLGAAVVGGMVGRRSARRQMESMQRQAQQAQQIQQVQAQAAQVQAQPQQTQGSAKTDPMQEIAKLGELKQKGLLTEEEFQKMKANLIAKM